MDNWTLAVSLNEQAGFCAAGRRHCPGRGPSVAVYKLKDTAGDRVCQPRNRSASCAGTTTAGRLIYTYRVAIRLLGGVQRAERQRWDAVGQVRLEQARHRRLCCLPGCPGAQEATVGPQPPQPSRWICGAGADHRGQGGLFTVELPGALCRQTIADYCMIGGTTAI